MLSGESALLSVRLTRTECTRRSWRAGITETSSPGMDAQIGVEKVIEEALRVVSDSPTYLTFDVDGIDPVFTPGTGTPEVGGLTTVESLRILRGIRGLNFVSGDVVEVAPPFDPFGGTALVGATLMFEMLCLFAEAIAKRSATQIPVSQKRSYAVLHTGVA